ncbi:hypothetical protein A2U01_0071697, partial [Trifolium medium]|nr:hypothetical protein [Trifolium medium]
MSCLRWIPSWYDAVAGDRLSVLVLPSCYDGEHRGAMLTSAVDLFFL